MLSGLLGEVLPDPYCLGLVVGVKVYYIEILDWLYVSHLVPNSGIKILNLSCPCFRVSFLSISDEDKGLGGCIPLSTGLKAITLSRS